MEKRVASDPAPPTTAMMARRVLGLAGLFSGIGLVITGIIMISLGMEYFGVNSQLWWKLSTNGATVLFVGAALAMFSPCLVLASKHRNPAAKVVLGVDDMLKTARDAGTRALQPGEPRERVIVREIVKVRCSYCNTLAELVAGKCPNCGASL